MKNEGYSDTIDGVEVSIINYTPDGVSRHTTIAKKLISCSMGTPIVALHSRCEETYDLFRIREGNTHIRLGPFADGDDSYTLPPGKYRVKITASQFKGHV